MNFILVNHHLTKTIEVTRVNLFNIMTQYRAIFNDDEHSPLVSSSVQNINQNIIFYTWIRDKVRHLFNYFSMHDPDIKGYN